MDAKKIPKAHGVRLNFIMNAILKMSAFIFPMITFPYVSRILGAEGNGKIAFAASVISYFSMFAQLGIPTYGIRVCAACRNDSRELNRTVQELLIINCITVVISYLALLVCFVYVPQFQVERKLMVITSCTILLNAVGVDWLFQALEQYSYITMRNLLFKVLSIVLMFAFVHKPEHYVLYGAISVLGTCGSNVFNIIYASRFLEHKPIGHFDFKRHLKPILNFFMLSVSVSVYTSMDSVMLGFMTSNTEVGYYAAATKMKAIVVSTVTALGAVLLPRISNIISERKLDKFYQMLHKSFNFAFVVSGAITVYCIYMSRDIIGFLAGERYFPSIVPMQIISVSIIFIALSNVTGMQVLVPTGREQYTTISTVYGAVINLVVNWIAIPYLGAAGAAIGTVVAEFTVLTVQLIYIRSEIVKLLKGIQFVKIIMANFLACVSLTICMKAVSASGYFVRLVISFIVYFGVYGLVLLVLKEEFFCYNIKKFRTVDAFLRFLKKDRR